MMYPKIVVLNLEFFSNFIMVFTAICVGGFNQKNNESFN